MCGEDDPQACCTETPFVTIFKIVDRVCASTQEFLPSMLFIVDQTLLIMCTASGVFRLQVHIISSNAGVLRPKASEFCLRPHVEKREVINPQNMEDCDSRWFKLIADTRFDHRAHDKKPHAKNLILIRSGGVCSWSSRARDIMPRLRIILSPVERKRAGT